MKKILYPNCSELIADFNIHDPKEFYKMIKEMGRIHQWLFDPVLSLKLLEDMVIEDMKEKEGEYRIVISIIDTKGRTTNIKYGNNGYDKSLGFYLDSGCYEEFNEEHFEFYQNAIDDCNAEMKTYDGGHLDGFEKWQQEHRYV